MRPNDYPVFAYRGSGFGFEVYPDRIVVVSRKLWKQTMVTHALAHVAQVAIKGAPARLHITMDDGTTAAYQLAGQVAAARDAIERLL